MSWQIRQDTNANRLTFTPDEGELFYATDTKTMWVGDGSTVGGVEIGNAPATYANAFNVKLWGATGDGVTDDLAAIQACVDAAGAVPAAVVIPDGDFVITDFIDVSAPGVSIYGIGAGSRIIAPTGSGKSAMKISASNVRVRDLTFVGGVSSELASANNAITILTGVDTLEISGCHFTGSDSTHGFNNQVLCYDSCSNVSVVNNVFDSVIGSSSGYGYGVVLANCTGGIVSGNKSTQSATHGRHHIYLSSACTDVVVYGNRLKSGVWNMIQVYTLASTSAAERCIIAANVLDGDGNGSHTYGAIVIVGNVNSCQVSCNTICNVDGRGISVEGFASGSVTCTDNSIIGNTIKGADDQGIFVTAAVRTMVEGNTIVDPCRVLSAPAISLLDNGAYTVDGSMVVGNRVYGTTHTYAITYNGDSVIVVGNSFEAGTSGYYNAVSTTNSVYMGNTGPASDVGLAAGDDTTPTVLGLRLLRIHGNYNPTAITQLDDGVPGQVVTLVNTLNLDPSTITDGGNFHLLGGNWGGVQYSAITLYTYDGTTWIELSRS